MLATVTLTALALGWLIGLRYPFFPARGERLLLLALPPFVLLAAAGLDALWLRWRSTGYVTLGLVVAASAASLAAFYTVPRYPDDDYRPLIARTVEQGLPEDTVFAVYPWQVGYWRSYGSPDGPAAVLTPDPAWGPAVSDALDAALARGRIWFPAHLALGGILETQAEAHLAGKAAPFVNEWYGPDTRLSAWAALSEVVPVAAPEVRFPLPGAGTEALELAGASASLAPAPAANAVVPLSLRWRAEAPPPVLDVSVRLTDDLGQIWAQHDYEPLGGISEWGLRTASSELTAADRPLRSTSAAGWQAEDRLGLLIPAGTPPGRYSVDLLVRPKGSGRPLDALGADGRPLGTAVPLFALEVAPAGRALEVERLPIGTRAEAPLGDGLRFLGYTADGAPATPGDLRKVSLFWQADRAPADDYVAFVQLLDRSGRAVPLWEAPPGAAYPTGRWASGTLMRSQAAFRIPAGLPDGRYRLIAGLFRAADGARLKTPRGVDYVSLGNIDVRGRAHEMNPPQVGHPAEIDFGGVGRLVGYDLDLSGAGPAPGGTLDLALHWQALAPADRAYTVFVHLLDEQGDIRGYGDGEPGRGQYPTTGWRPGEYLADPHTVTLAPDAPPGTYRLAIGFYDPATGERLKTAEGADQVVLETPVTVRR